MKKLTSKIFAGLAVTVLAFAAVSLSCSKKSVHGTADTAFADTNPATADIEVQPQLTFSAGSNSFAFAVNLEFCDNTTIKFPISWSYSF